MWLGILLLIFILAFGLLMTFALIAIIEEDKRNADKWEKIINKHNNDKDN